MADTKMAWWLVVSLGWVVGAVPFLAADFRLADTTVHRVDHEGGHWASCELGEHVAHRSPPERLFLSIPSDETTVLNAIRSRWPDIVRVDELPRESSDSLLAITWRETGWWTPLDADRVLTIRAAHYEGDSSPASHLAEVRPETDHPPSTDPTTEDRSRCWRASVLAVRDTYHVQGIVSRPSLLRQVDADAEARVVTWLDSLAQRDAP